MKKNRGKILWAFFCAALAVITTYSCGDPKDPECQLLVTMVFTVATFPAGIAFVLVGNIVVALMGHLGFSIESSVVALIILLLGFTVVGYVQLFVLLPRLLERLGWKSHHSRDSAL